MDSLSPAVPISPAHFADDPLLKALFISERGMHDVFRRDRSLKEFLLGPGNSLVRITAILFMERVETAGFGIEITGDMTVRDVPHVTVCFESHILFDPAEDEIKTRLKLKKRAFDYLVRIALQRITAAKGKRKELERQSALLQSMKP